MTILHFPFKGDTDSFVYQRPLESDHDQGRLGMAKTFDFSYYPANHELHDDSKGKKSHEKRQNNAD